VKGQSVMGYGLRPMGWGDISQVSVIEREAFPTNWSGTNYTRELKNLQSEYVVCVRHGELAPVLSGPPRRSFLDVLRGKPAFYSAAEPPELVVGFVGLWFTSGEGHIVSIAVREAHRRQGLGELLLLGAVELTARRQQQVVTLEVRVSNDIAQSLYSKYGFTQVGIRRGYYSDNREDAYIMSTGTISSPEYQHMLGTRCAEFANRYGEADRVYR
jgi:ribosomal-protein-alanine N-acetyltransferase